MIFILKYWKFGIGAVAGALIMFGVCEARIWFMKASHALQIESAKASIIKQCEEDKKITLEVSNEYEIELTDLNRRLADLNRVQPTLCIPIAGATSERHASTGAGPVDGNGIVAETLYDYGGAAERYRRQLIACQSFISRTWEAKRGPP